MPNLENYDIYAFGHNKYGQLALNDTTHRTTPEKIKFFKNEKIVNIVGGWGHTFFISGNKNCFNLLLPKIENEKIYGVGENVYGQIGIVSTKPTFVPILISVENLHPPNKT